MAEAKKKEDGYVKVRLLKNYFVDEDKKMTPAQSEVNGLMLPVEEAERLCDAGAAEPYSRFGETEDEGNG